MGSLCKSGSLVEMNDSSELQHIYRGTAFATTLSQEDYLLKKPSFNPSIEGQPLQHHFYHVKW